MYFNKMPVIAYGSKIDSLVKARNILESAKFTDFFKENQQKLFVEYKLKDGETPEYIAYKVYQNPELNWIILLFNDIINPYVDWPKSQEQLENYIQNEYSGSAIFINPEISQFSKIDNTLYSSSQSQFVKGNTISHENGYWSATIKNWDSTLRKIEITNITGNLNSNISNTYTGRITSKNKNGNTFYCTIGRVVFDNTYSLHHFEDNNGNYIDPYQDFISRNTNSNEIPAINESFILKNYINGYDENVITNRQYEETINDNKRNIKVLKIDYLDFVINQYNKLF